MQLSSLGDRVNGRNFGFQIKRSILRCLFCHPPSHPTAFTLVEMLMVITIVGILIGIVAPSWLGWHTNRLLSAAQDEALQAMRKAQLQAIQAHLSWRVSFRVVANQVEWGIHPANVIPSESQWQSLHPQVRLAPTETTLQQENSTYFVEFNPKGNVKPPFGRLSFMSLDGDRRRSCIFVSTLLGAMRKATGQECYK